MANIKLIRIDFRLIHGQVVNKWIKITRSNKIVVIDDSLASNEFMRSVYIMAAPPGVDVQVYSINDAIKEWKENQFGEGEVLVLLRVCLMLTDVSKRVLKSKNCRLAVLAHSRDVRLFMDRSL